MGGRSSKTKPERHEAEVTAVEIFEDRQGEPESSQRRKRSVSNQSGQIKVVQTVKKPVISVAEGDADATAQTPTKTGAESGGDLEADQQQTKKKRRRSKKEKRKSQPAKLVHANTALNGLHGAKPPLGQNTEQSQKHFELIKDAYALDHEATRAASFSRSPDARPRFFSFDHWRKTPLPLVGKGSSRMVLSPVVAPPLLRSKTAPMQEKKEPGLDSSGRPYSPHNMQEVSVHEAGDEDIFKDLEELQRTASFPFGDATRVTGGVVESTQASAAPPRRNGTGDEEHAATLSTPPTQRELHLDDFDEDLMENILSDNSDG